MKLLAVDTTTNACSVALRVNNDVIELNESLQKGHAERVLPMVDQLLGQAQIRLQDIDALVVDHGPGSFTGIRVGVGIVQGLAFAADLPVVCLSSLAILAQGSDGASCLSVIDARMQQVYFALYTRSVRGELKLHAPAQLAHPDALHQALSSALVSAGDQSESVPRFVGVGSGFAAYGEVLSHQLGDTLQSIDAQAMPLARNALALATVDWSSQSLLSAEQVLPLYIRNQVVHQRR